jgi:hypothetical protein
MTPRKIAIFVEGQTEQIFVKKLLTEMAGYKQISIEIFQIGGTKKNREFIHLESNDSENNHFFALLYDCGNESHVLSDIKKQHKQLTDKGYHKIIGIRDLYPKSLSDQHQLEKGMKGFIQPLNKQGIPVYLILAIMEVEAWFLSDYTCFSKIDERLTPEFILHHCQLDLMNIEIETVPHPTSELDKIYQLIGQNYTKNKEQVQTIVNYLDYEFIYLELILKVKQLKKLIKEIDEFLSQPSY